jgi:hypothetical protein
MQSKSEKGFKSPLPHIVYDEECTNIFHLYLITKVLEPHPPDLVMDIVLWVIRIAFQKDIHVCIKCYAITHLACVCYDVLALIQFLPSHEAGGASRFFSRGT